MKIVNQFDMQPEITPFKRGFADVMLESLEVSFSDPYSSEVIDIPARGSQCKHLPCFDLKTYLTVTCHIGGHSWTCPYCL